MPFGSILAAWISLGSYFGCLGAHFGGLGHHFGGLGLILEALDLILEALGDILGMAWVPDWPGDLRMGWIALSPRREQCFTRIQGSRG